MYTFITINQWHTEFIMKDLSSLPLADRYAILSADIKELTAELEKLKAEVKASGRDVIQGVNATLKVNIFERSSLDTAAVKAILTPEQVAACTKTSDVVTITVKAKVATVLA